MHPSLLELGSRQEPRVCALLPRATKDDGPTRARWVVILSNISVHSLVKFWRRYLAHYTVATLYNNSPMS
jgi:hypothetical protein